MGGRGAKLNRNAEGWIVDLKWHSVKTVEVKINGESKTVKIVEKNNPTDKPGLPTYSNSPNSIYGVVDPETGGIERFRVFDEKSKAVIDFDYHSVSGSEPFSHKHMLDFENPKKTRKSGHGGEHEPISESDRQQYGLLLEKLNKNPVDM